MKTLPNIIELQLLAVDFKDTLFNIVCDCAVSRACKRQLGVTDVVESVTACYIDNKLYRHIPYGYSCFKKDKEAAQTAEPNTVIRTIKLTRYV